MKLSQLLSLFACLVAFSSMVHAETLTQDHPTADIVKKYLRAIVDQDWHTSSQMLVPTSLERRKLQIIEAIKRSPTITAEAAALATLGLKDLRDLEKMPAQEVYMAERKAMHERLGIKPEVMKRKQETFKATILGLIGEDKGKTVHALVRTSQETGDTVIEELLLISLVQDKDSTQKWLIAPDMQNPVTRPLSKAEEKK